MSKQNNLIVLIVAAITVAITVVIINGGSFLLMDRLIPTLTRKRSTATKPNKDQLTLLGDTFSGYSTFRSAEFQNALKEV